MKLCTWFVLCATINVVMAIIAGAVLTWVVRNHEVSVYSSALEGSPNMNGGCIQIAKEGYRPLIECIFTTFEIANNRMDFDFKLRVLH
jgi:hypothetical protein